MADFSALIQRIKDAVYENGVQAITGQILQDCLKDVVNTVNVAKQDGIYRVTVTVDNNTGVPSATARMDDDTYTLEFSFHNLKGQKGDKGDKGDTPVLTADSDGVIYSDGVMLTRVIKDTTDALTTRADSDHARAESDHARAETDHTDITRARLDAETAAGEANYASLRANTAADNADAAREAIQSDLAQKQDVIPDLQQIRAGATDTVKYTSQSLTDAQKGQARTNIGAASDSEVSQLRSKIAGKADKDGYYPEMSVGSLKGTEVTQVEGISTIAKSTGIAKINEVMGRSLVWNQLAPNRAPDLTGATETYSDNWTTATLTNATNIVRFSAGFVQTDLAPGDKIIVFSNIRRYEVANASYDSLYNSTLWNRTKQQTAVQSYTRFKTPSVTAAYIVISNNVVKGDEIGFYLDLNNAQPFEHTTDDILEFTYAIYHLTQTYSPGNEPATVEEFIALNPQVLGAVPYNAGEIISNNTEALEITGLNQWDEEWEVGTINATTGEKSTGANSIRSKNDFPALPNTVYYYYCPASHTGAANAGSARMAFLDANHNTISVKNAGVLNSTFSTPEGCRFLRFSTHVSQYGSTYYNDICINVSGSRDGEYEPYQKSELELNLATITGKLNGEGESVVIFPDGPGSVMDAYDRLIVDDDGWCRRAIRTVFSLDLGNLNWTYNKNNQGAFTNNGYASLFASGRNLCAKYTSPETSRPASMPDKSIAINSAPIVTSGNFSSKEIVIKDSSYTVPADLKASLTGVKLYYEGYPQEYVLDTPIYMGIKTEQGGVIRQLPENGSAPTTAPMRMSVTYALPPEALISGASLENLLNALKTANKITNYTMTYNPTSGKWEFTIS